MTATAAAPTFGIGAALAAAGEAHPGDLDQQADYIRHQLDGCLSWQREGWQLVLRSIHSHRQPRLRLSREDVNAIRKADDVDAHLDEEGRHWLKCMKRRTYAERERNPFLEDQTIRIEVDGGVTAYEKNDVPGMPLTGFSRVRHHETLGRLLSPGDHLSLHWIRGNNCDLLVERHLSQDELHATIWKKNDSKRTRQLELVLDIAARPNNFTRLVRPAGKTW